MSATVVEHKATTAPGLLHPDFEFLVQKIIQAVAKDNLEDMRRDFHTRLRIMLSQPDDTELIEDLWDFFYDWCVFEQKVPDNIENLSAEDQALWQAVREGNQRGLYTITKANDTVLKLKELYTGKSFVVGKQTPNDYVGIERGDIVEARLLTAPQTAKKKEVKFAFVRRPSYHPIEVHAYIKQKVKQFRKSQDFSTYQSWLWLLVGMYLKHRIYHQMPIEKIYDDNSRI